MINETGNLSQEDDFNKSNLNFKIFSNESHASLNQAKSLNSKAVLNDSAKINIGIEGSLPSLLNDDEFNSIKELTITGRIDVRDLYYLGSMPELRYLDLFYAVIVAYNGRALNYDELTFEIINNPSMADNYKLYVSYPPNEIPFQAFCDEGSIKNLTTVILPNTTTAINDCAFRGCRKLKNIEIPQSVKEIKSFAFEDCWGLTTIRLGKNVEHIGSSAFSTYSLEEILVDPLNKNYLSVDGVLYNKSQTELIVYPCKHGTEFSIPNGVISIAKSAFHNSQFTYLSIPDTVTSIRESAFSESNMLKEIIISNSVTRIENLLFTSCPMLKKVTLGKNVNSIGKRSFLFLKELEAIHCLNANPPKLDSESFMGTTSVKNVFVPSEEAVLAYKKNELWLKAFPGDIIKREKTK
jgi:hypothetical protein